MTQYTSNCRGCIDPLVTFITSFSQYGNTSSQKTDIAKDCNVRFLQNNSSIFLKIIRIDLCLSQNAKSLIQSEKAAQLSTRVGKLKYNPK